MSRITANIASLVARRAIRINRDSPTERPGTSRPGTCIRSGKDGAGPTADLPDRSAGIQNGHPAAIMNSLLIARENIVAAECAIHDVNFAIEASMLTQARILMDNIDRLRRCGSPGGWAGERPGEPSVPS